MPATRSTHCGMRGSVVTTPVCPPASEPCAITPSTPTSSACKGMAEPTMCTAHSTQHSTQHTAQHTAHSTQHTAHSTHHTALLVVRMCTREPHYAQCCNATRRLFKITRLRRHTKLAGLFAARQGSALVIQRHTKLAGLCAAMQGRALVIQKHT